MTINPTIDAIAAQIAGWQAFVAKMDGTKPVTVTIDGATVTVDPAVMPDIYNGGTDYLRNAFSKAIASAREALADATLAASVA